MGVPPAVAVDAAVGEVAGVALVAVVASLVAAALVDDEEVEDVAVESLFPPPHAASNPNMSIAASITENRRM
ncbi:MAG TPA: hypothetical protein VHA53_08320, partial [Nitrolancea sp.]|nr:hypothetical protein [Nitrolancea sp.]